MHLLHASWTAKPSAREARCRASVKLGHHDAQRLRSAKLDDPRGAVDLLRLRLSVEERDLGGVQAVDAEEVGVAGCGERRQEQRAHLVWRLNLHRCAQSHAHVTRMESSIAYWSHTRHVEAESE
jgi:hypothetical protein